MHKNDTVEKFRIDKWLFASRFFKTRALAAVAIEKGRVYLNDARVKPAKQLCIGDMLKIKIGHYQYEVEVLELSNHRGPAPQAQQLYCETESSRQQRQTIASHMKAQPTFHSKGRPTKRDRRDIARLKNEV